MVRQMERVLVVDSWRIFMINLNLHMKVFGGMVYQMSMVKSHILHMVSINRGHGKKAIGLCEFYLSNIYCIHPFRKDLLRGKIWSIYLHFKLENVHKSWWIEKYLKLKFRILKKKGMLKIIFFIFCQIFDIHT